MNKWDLIAVGCGAFIAHLCFVTPLAVFAGGAAAWGFKFALDPARRSYAHYVAAVAKATVGDSWDSLDVKAILNGINPHTVNWCAFFAQGIMRRAANEMGREMIVPGDGGALLTATQFQDGKAGTKWIAKESLNSRVYPPPGSLAFWTRLTGSPPSNEGAGHVGIVISSTPTTFTTVEGNNGDPITAHLHHYSESNLIGFGVFTV